MLTKECCGNVYYSEYRRNAFCDGPQCPYPSTVDGNTYYLAWEDWEGAVRARGSSGGGWLALALVSGLGFRSRRRRVGLE